MKQNILSTKVDELGIEVPENLSGMSLDEVLYYASRYVKQKMEYNGRSVNDIKDDEVYSFGWTRKEVMDLPSQNTEYTDLPGEVWYDIGNGSKYQVSSYARVRSLPHRSEPSDRFPRGRRYRGKILKQYHMPLISERPRVMLRDEDTGRLMQVSIIYLYARHVCGLNPTGILKTLNQNPFDIRCPNIIDVLTMSSIEKEKK